MPRALIHESPYWSDADDERRVADEPLYVWPGHMRIVSARRAGKLRKRGVRLLPLHPVFDHSGGVHGRGRFEPTTPNKRARYAWFEPATVFDHRKARKGGACYQTWLEAERGLRGRKADLQERLAYQRERLQLKLYALARRRKTSETVTHGTAQGRA